MPVSEGATTLPLDSGSVPVFGLYDATNFYLWRSPTGDTQAATGVAAVGLMAMGQGTTTYQRVRSGDMNNIAAATGLLDILPALRYDASLPTLTNGRWNALQGDVSGRLHVTNSRIEFAEDAPHVSGDLGVMALGVRQDTLAALGGTTGDYVPSQYDELGALWTRERQTRDAGVLHRSALSAADKCAAPVLSALSGQTVGGGSLVSGTTYYASAVAFTKQPGSGAVVGTTTPATVVSASPGGSNNALRLPIAQVTGADGYYLFLSVDAAAPKQVAVITEAERAAGGLVTAAMGAVGAGGTAGAIDVGVVGTGLQTTATTFANFNSAHRIGTPSDIVTVGYRTAIIHARWKFNGVGGSVISTIPSVTLLAWTKSKEGSPDYFYTSPFTMGAGQSNSEGYQQVAEVDVRGAAAMRVTCPVFSGSGTLDVWIELIP